MIRWPGRRVIVNGDPTADGDDRGRARTRRIAISTAAAFVGRFGSVAITLVTVPIALGYLGLEQYGLWMAVVAVGRMLVFADLGIGNGLMNVVSERLALDDRMAARRALSTATALLLATGAMVAVVVVVIAVVVPWAELFNLRSSGRDLAAGVVAAVGLATVAGLPLSLIERVRYSLQQGYVNAGFTLAGLLAGLAGLVLLIQVRAGLIAIVVVMAAGPLIALIGNGAALLRRYPWLRPSIGSLDATMARRLLRLGGLFFVLQLSMAVAFQSDVVVAAAVLGPAEAGTYAVVLRLFMLAPALIELLLLQVWPAYTEALARGDIAWVRATLRRSALIAFVGSGAASLALLVGGTAILDVWTNGAVRAEPALLLGMAVWAVVQATLNAANILMNAAAVIRFQIVVLSVMAVASIAASVVLARAIGLAGVIWGTVGAYVVFAAVPIVLYMPRLLKRLEADALHTSESAGAPAASISRSGD